MCTPDEACVCVCMCVCVCVCLPGDVSGGKGCVSLEKELGKWGESSLGDMASNQSINTPVHAAHWLSSSARQEGGGRVGGGNALLIRCWVAYLIILWLYETIKSIVSLWSFAVFLSSLWPETDSPDYPAVSVIYKQKEKHLPPSRSPKQEALVGKWTGSVKSLPRSVCSSSHCTSLTGWDWRRGNDGGGGSGGMDRDPFYSVPEGGRRSRVWAWWFRINSRTVKAFDWCYRCWVFQFSRDSGELMEFVEVISASECNGHRVVCRRYTAVI